MDPLYVLRQLGGIASSGELRKHCTKRSLAKAVSRERIVAVGKGRYAVPGLEAAWREAHRLSGVVSGRSAAQFWGLNLRLVPGEEVTPVVTVARNRRVEPGRRVGVDLKWRDLSQGSVVDVASVTRGAAGGRVTSLVQTVLDCCRDLPEVDALCVVDAALRRGVLRDDLLARADELPRSCRSRVRGVIELGDGRAATAFETCLRHIARSVPGLTVTPQVVIGQHRVDLADTDLRIVIEAESYAFHGSKEMFRADTRRYTWLVVDNWMVVRFVWEDVMLKPDWVRDELIRAVAVRESRPGHRSAG
ncbi:DUF559 domain-containing protein [Nocardioides sp. Soil796]|uniref:DUF559 domain-containing protein n=1 Tax=Nocardioides sp. Soil796 TaxID=1736412 RepID=UPI00070E985F|nr:DUF559 domain-containing protein [Nocardioides sp. Soil796]KRF12782.1 hypothetical protein ASH02_14735 [Nocardioides sp. Soil796]